MDKDNLELRDITNRDDIEHLMNLFYAKALKDKDIGVFFTEIAQIDLENHLPHIVDFWKQQLFHIGHYKKNVLQIHQNLHLKKAIENIHFDIWLDIFTTTIDSNYKGPKADLMKTRALSIATVMRIKTRS